MKLKIYYPAIVLASATLFFIYDIVGDLLDQSESLFHVIVELMVFFAISVVLFIELGRVGRLKSEVSLERDKTARLSGELLNAMNGQFTDWGLSPTERDVALLLIKGLSMKEVSSLREVKEKTVRQQAASIYAKSGCAGRHELVAYFIDDLMSQ